MVAQVDRAYIQERPTKLFSRLISYALFEGRPLTTRGQWINSFVFAHFAIEKRLPQMRCVEKPAFILGTGRSGTTILGIVLSMHRDVGFLNEPKAMWHSIYPEEDLIGSYSRGPAKYRLGAADVCPAERRNAHRLFGAYLASIFSSRLVDKYPELIFRVPFVKEIFPDAKFIFLVRNGWDTCSSIEGWSNRLGQQVNGETHDWWGVNRRKWYLLVEQIVSEHEDLAHFSTDMLSWTNHTDMAAVEWIVTMREGMRLIEVYSEEVLRVDYESLCANSEHEIKRIAKFLGFQREDNKFIKYAKQTLKSVTPAPSFELHQSIKKPFMETMEKLGY